MLYFWLVLLVLVWAATIWVGTRIAWAKGRSQLLGGLIAALLPFVGLAVMWALPAREPARTLREAAVEQHERAEQAEALERRDAEEQTHRRRRSRRGGRARTG